MSILSELQVGVIIRTLRNSPYKTLTLLSKMKLCPCEACKTEKGVFSGYFLSEAGKVALMDFGTNDSITTIG